MPLILEISTIVFVPAIVMFYLSWQMFGCRAYVEYDTPGISKILLKDGFLLASYISGFFAVFSPLSSEATYFILEIFSYEKTSQPLIDHFISRVIIFLTELIWTGIWGYLGYRIGKSGVGYQKREE